MEKKNKQRETVELEKIILEYWPQINFRVQRSLGYLNPDWEDIAGDILINVIESIRKKKFRGESSIGTFIYVITSRRIIDYIRKKSRVLKHLPVTERMPDPLEYVENKEKTELILKSIKKLKPKYADMLYLFYYGGITQKEIAQIFKISSRRVNELLNDAKESLKTIIIDRGWG